MSRTATLNTTLSQELEDEFGRFMSVPAVAEVTATSESTVRRWVAAGALKLYKMGPTRTLRIRTADVAALIQQVA